MKSYNNAKTISGIAPALLAGGRIGSIGFIILASFLLILGLVNPQAMSGIRTSAADSAAPILSFFTKPFVSLSNTISGVSGMAELRAENAKLQSENIRLKEWYQTALMLQAENHSLQELLNIKVAPEHKFVTARVLSDAGNAFVKTALINAGRDEGVLKNQAVLSGEGMIGRVIETGNSSSRILLLTDINSRIPVLIEGSSQKAVMAGNNSPYPNLVHLPQDAGIVKNSRVVTSGHGGIFPPGLPIGRVVSVPNEGYKVLPYADMGRVTYVRVLDASANKDLILQDPNILP